MSSPRFQCTSDAKARIMQLTKVYMDLLSGGSYNAVEVSEAAGTPVEGPLPKIQAYAVARALTEKAFVQPLSARRYFLSPDLVPVYPSHCDHMDVLHATELTQLVDAGQVTVLNDYVSKALATPLHLCFAFTGDASQLGDMGYPDVASLFPVLERASRIDGQTVGTTVAKLAKDFTRSGSIFASWGLTAGQSSLTIFGRDVELVQLHARALWTQVLCLPCLTGNELISVMLALPDNTEDQHEVRSALLNHMARCPAAVMLRLVEQLQNELLLRFTSPHKQLIGIANCIALLHEANFLVVKRGIIDYTKFQNPTGADFDLRGAVQDYERYMRNKSSGPSDQLFSFADYPCLVGAKFKSYLMMVEAHGEQAHARERYMVSAMMTRSDASALNDNFLVLKIDRLNLIQSTLQQIMIKSSRLKKPLRVQFVGEAGIDEGGVRKEFFQLVAKQLLDPNFGMFEPRGTFLWFQPTVRCNMQLTEFRLIGQILGLAVYNNVILDVNFPKVVYRKLLNWDLDFEDLRELDPSLAHGLTELLNFQEEEGATVEDIFCRTFTQEYDIFGEPVEVPLCPGGETKALTGANRQEYVDCFTRHVLEDSIKGNFEAFKAGFFSVADRTFLTAMHPEELELLVAGNPVYDFADLKAGTSYEGYEPTDQVIVWMWEVLDEFDTVQKKLFLRFVTGSDRVPIGGLKEIRFVVGKNGDDSAQLPTSHTCFNHLLLSAYSSKEKLKEKFLLAIENCTGFGLK